jgi:hypothetical protein
MALLDFDGMGSDFQNFLKSPQAQAMAASLLKSGGVSPRPINMSEAFGNALTAGQEAQMQDLQKQYMQQMIDDQKRKAEGAKQFGALVGQKATTPEEAGMIFNPQFYKGKGFLGNEFGLPEFKIRAAGLLGQGGNIKEAVGLLSGDNEYGAPVQALDASGKPVFVVPNKQGSYKTLDGIMPIPKKGMSLIQGPDGTFEFSQGGWDNPLADGFLKDPKQGTLRGGQGGTYVNPKTGEIISTNTNKMATTDQTTIAAIDRVNPQINRILKTLPQFQKASRQGQAYAAGLANTFFGADYKLPSELAAGHAALESAPEALLKAFGLNTTDQALTMMRKTVEPAKGESANGYKERVLEQLKEIKMFQDQSKNRLANGISLKTSNDPQTAHQQSAQASGQVMIKTPDGRVMSMPAGNVEQALKLGAQRIS